MKRALYALIFAAATLIPAAAAHAQVSVAVGVGPAAIVYGAACPGPDYLWAPGYYAGTVWMPGRWIYRTYYHTYYHPYDRGYVHGYDHGYARGYAHNDHYDHGYRR
jgi:hypothetical protein